MALALGTGGGGAVVHLLEQRLLLNETFNGVFMLPLS